MNKAIPTLDIGKLQGATISRDLLYSFLQGALEDRDIEFGKKVYILAVSSSLDGDAIFGDHLVRLFAVCGHLQDANRVFTQVPHPSIYTWNALISINAKCHETKMALYLYARMQEKGRKPSRITFLSILRAFDTPSAIAQARMMHEQIIYFGCDSHVTIGNMLVDMYAKCGSLDEACLVFNKMSHRDVVSWGSVIAGFSHNCQGLAALELFGRMQQGGVKPNSVIYLAILKACGSARALTEGRMMHDFVSKFAINLDVNIGSSLVDMYAKCGSLKEAHKMFDNMLSRTVVSWGAMISGYAEQGDGHLAVHLFEAMKQEGLEPDKVLFSSILKGCSSIGAVIYGRSIHSQILSSGVELDLVLGNTLLDMYAKCGNLEETCDMFHSLPGRDAVSWGSLIAGLARHGKYRHVEECLKEMEHEGIKPGDAIFSSIFTTCSNSGLATEALHFLKVMIEEYGLAASIEHLNCIVEILGRMGLLREAEHVLQTMPNSPGVMGWTSLLTSCTNHGSADIGRRCFHAARVMGPDDASGYLLMVNLLSEHVQSREPEHLLLSVQTSVA